MRAAYVTGYDAADLDVFNGSAYWVAKCMRRQSIDVDLIGPLRNDAHRYAVGIKHRLYERLLHRRYDWQRTLSACAPSAGRLRQNWQSGRRRRPEQRESSVHRSTGTAGHGRPF
jgi:hypothetical protein